EAEIFRRSQLMSDRRNVDRVRIGGTDDDAADVMRIGESHLLPRFSGVGRLVDAVAPRRALTIVRFAAAGPDDRWIGWRDRDCADRRRSLIIEHRLPRRAAVARFEDAA